MSGMEDELQNPPLDHGSIGDGCVLDNNNNSVADVEALICTVSLLHPIFVDDGDVGADAGVFIEDGCLHSRSFTNAKGNSSTFTQKSAGVLSTAERMSIPSEKEKMVWTGGDATKEKVAAID